MSLYKTGCSALFIVSILAASLNVNAQSLAYVGQQILLPTDTVPVGTGTFSGNTFGGTLVGGLSGIDRDRNTGNYWAISDDRSQANPARFYNLSLDLNQFARSNTPGAGGVVFNSVATIQAPAGGPFGALQVDPEGIRLNAGSNSSFWSNEGQRSAAGFQNPTLREMTATGAYVRDFSVPTRYNPVGSAAANTAGDAGIRNNLAFETVALSPDGNRLYTATENALAQDGPAAAIGVPSRSRVIEFDTTTGSATAEFAYLTDPVAVPPNPSGTFATNGLVEMLALGDRQFVTLERSFSSGVGNNIRLYYADARLASDVSAIDSLAGASVVPIEKQLLLDLSTLRNDDNSPLVLDNIEGITWGPTLANGNRSLILVSDNNFSGTQFTQFIALEAVGPIPEPREYALLVAGLGLLFWKLRCRVKGSKES